MLYFFNFFLILFSAPTYAQEQQFWLNFTINEVVQCAPIAINFSNIVNGMDLPMTLTILPFSSEVLIMPIPTVAWNTSGLSVSFLPLQADQEFIASLDDNTGNSVAQVSQVTKVLSSPTNNSSCLSSTGLGLRLRDENFKLLTTPVQCQDITISYNLQQVQRAPTVRVFAPNSDSAILPQTSDDPRNGTATYTMVVHRGTQVLLMFDDGLQHRETTDLLTVAGSSDSPRNCLSKDRATVNTTPSATGNSQGNNQGSAGIPQAVIIGCSAGAAAILIIVVSMVIFVIRDRRLRRQRNVMGTILGSELALPEPSEDPKIMNTVEVTTRSPFGESQTVEDGGKDEGYVTNPPYVMPELQAKGDSEAPLARSFSSWTHDDEPDTREASLHRPSVDPVQVLDIEGMLNNMATALSGTQANGRAMGNEEYISESLHSRGDSQSTVRSLGIPYPAFTHSFQTQPRHRRDPSDVPADLTGSGTLSAFSMVMPNPSGNDPTELPSPFNRTDESAKPASDIVRPLSVERQGKGKGSTD